MSPIGNYNPHAPIILGEEWVPIRDEDLVYSPVVNSVELGTEFTLATSRQVRDARFYLHELTQNIQSFQTGLVNIYPSGLEDQTGPISQVLIPVNSATTTGANISNSGGSSIAEVVYQPGDSKSLLFAYNSGTVQRVSFFFAVNQYPVLANKRILNVSLLYAGNVVDFDPITGLAIPFVNPTPGTVVVTQVRQRNDAGSSQAFTAIANPSNTGTLSELATAVNNAPGNSYTSEAIQVLNLGDINNFWNSAIAPGSTSDRMPWRYVDLQKFEASAGVNRQHILVDVTLPTTPYTAISGGIPQLELEYIALRIIYCEEKRVAYGAKRFNPYVYGANIITMRDQFFNTDPILTAGTYLPTLSWISPGRVDFGQSSAGEFPELNALRELYQIPSHPGVQLDIPFPLAESLGDTFTSEVTHVLPQLTLHASGGPLTEPHVYGRQGHAEVYGANTATQDIYDDISGVAANYPQVRFYARRFGDTTIPLTLTGVAPLNASTVSISAADFDALEEIIDGWKEITLRFATPPSMGTVAGNPAWTWSSTAETGGNRWEVLAACAPAISGIAGSLYTLVPAPNQLGTATYQPPAGDTVELTWMPQGVASPWVTGATIDPACDAVLIFSQDPQTITGVSISQLTQTITGIGLDCGSLPCCIPSGIGYQRVAWTSQIAGGGLLLPGISGSYASTPDAAQIDVLGDIDLRVEATLPQSVWIGTAGTLLSKYDSTVNQRAYRFYIELGFLRLAWSINGAAVLAVSPDTPVSVPANGRLAVRVTMDVDDGGGNRVIRFFTAPSIDGTYTQLGSTITTVGTTSIFNSSAALIVGAINNGAGDVLNPMGGIIHSAQVRNGIAGTVVAFPDFSSQPAGTTTFTDSTGLVWTINGTAAIVRGSVSTAGISGLELQRWDSLQSDFETIMLSTDYSLLAFNDYEARVGLASVYRIRALNVLNFAGAWSTYVTGIVVAPGISGGCPDNTGALIFTSNAAQSGIYNAAYVMQWEGFPDETFSLPEAGMVDFQPMYGADGSVAFHGTERGLSAFSRLILLHAAAIQPVRLADAQILRDLAWADLPYICVRDDIGDRWFANVRVPSVSARMDRTKYMAKVDITELTSSPFPVNP